MSNEGQIYHVWFATKRRKWLLDGELEDRVKQLMLETAARHEIDILALETMIDHAHVLIRVREGQTLASCVNKLKGASARLLFQEMPELKMDIESDHFWQRRYGCKPIPPAAVPTVKRYIETQKDRPEKYER